MSQLEDLRQCAEDLGALINEAKQRAQAQGISPYRALTPSGAPVLAPLLVAQAQVLTAIRDAKVKGGRT